MTKVTVIAECDPSEQVEVEVIDGDKDGEFSYLQNGETKEYQLEKDQKIIVAEIPN